MTLKSIFDFTLSLTLIIIGFPVILILILIATINTNSFGIFSQHRIGQKGKIFSLYKIRTMKGVQKSNITLSSNQNITKFGRFLRKYKLDELPQLFNILLGQMSFVGPRPDVPGYADNLKGDDRIILNVKPGIFGPAQLKYSNEAKLLSNQENPIKYNDEVIWPDKVKINKEYVKNWSFKKDLQIIVKTIKLVFFK